MTAALAALGIAPPTADTGPRAPTGDGAAFAAMLDAAVVPVRAVPAAVAAPAPTNAPISAIAASAPSTPVDDAADPIPTGATTPPPQPFLPQDDVSNLVSSDATASAAPQPLRPDDGSDRGSTGTIDPPSATPLQGDAADPVPADTITNPTTTPQPVMPIDAAQGAIPLAPIATPVVPDRDASVLAATAAPVPSETDRPASHADTPEPDASDQDSETPATPPRRKTIEAAQPIFVPTPSPVAALPIVDPPVVSKASPAIAAPATPQASRQPVSAAPDATTVPAMPAPALPPVQVATLPASVASPAARPTPPLGGAVDLPPAGPATPAAAATPPQPAVDRIVATTASVAAPSTGATSADPQTIVARPDPVILPQATPGRAAGTDSRVAPSADPAMPAAGTDRSPAPAAAASPPTKSDPAPARVATTVATAAPVLSALIAIRDQGVGAGPATAARDDGAARSTVTMLAARNRPTPAPVATAETVASPTPARRRTAAADPVASSTGQAVPTTVSTKAGDAAPIADPAAAQLAAGGVDRSLDVARQAAWADGIARDIASAGATTGTARFTVATAALGPVAVAVSRSADGTDVRLGAGSAVARDALADARPQLIAEARAQGLHIRDAQVDLGGMASGGSGSHRHDTPQPAPTTTAATPTRSATDAETNSLPSTGYGGATGGDGGRQAQQQAPRPASPPPSGRMPATAAAVPAAAADAPADGRYA